MTKEENAKRIERLKNIVLNMPEKPGSYQYYDDLRENGGTIIYVGKAKNLKRRVSSYFHKEVDRFTRSNTGFSAIFTMLFSSSPRVHNSNWH